jgi:hypothetical protein
VDVLPVEAEILDDPRREILDAGLSMKMPPAIRMPSGRWIASSLITSAPRFASIWQAEGPAHQAVVSSTRIPASGRGASFAAEGAMPATGRSRASIASECSPTRGTGSKGLGSLPSSM